MGPITYKKVLAAVGKERVDEVSHEICQIHGGLGYQDFKYHNGGIDISGLTEADQSKVTSLMEKPVAKKEGAK